MNYSVSNRVHSFHTLFNLSFKMKFTLFALIPAIVAVPFKRYENATTADFDPFNSTSTTTLTQFTTIQLPSTTLVVPASATSQLSILSDWMEREGMSTVTTYVTSYETLTSDNSVVTQPVTLSSEYVVAKTDINPMDTEIETSGCQAITVTKTETETETVTETVGGITSATEEETTYSTIYLTSTLTSSYPVTAELTYSDLTTTLTTFVEITTTSTYQSTTALPTSYSNTTSVLPSMTLNPTVGYNSTSF